MRGNSSPALDQIPTDPCVPNAWPLREAFERTRGERASLRKDELLQPNLHVHGAAMTALDAYPAIEALIPELERELVHIDLELIRSIPLKADAASYAESLHAGAVESERWYSNEERVRAIARLAETGLERQRALTLLVRAYDEARRALTYVRWKEDDVDLIAPSLYGGHALPARKRSADAEVQTTEDELCSRVIRRG